MIIFHFFYSISTAYAYVWYTTNGNDDDRGGFGRNRPTGVAQYSLRADEMDTKRMRLHNVFNVSLAGALVGDQQGFCEPKFRLLRLFQAHYLLVVSIKAQWVCNWCVHENRCTQQRQHMPAHLTQRRECKSICIYLFLHHLSPAHIREFPVDLFVCLLFIDYCLRKRTGPYLRV